MKLTYEQALEKIKHLVRDKQVVTKNNRKLIQKNKNLTEKNLNLENIKKDIRTIKRENQKLVKQNTKLNNTILKKKAKRTARTKKILSKQEIEERKKQQEERKKQRAAIKRKQNKETQKRLKEQKEAENIYITNLCNFIKKMYYYKFTKIHKNRKYDIETIIREVLYILKTGTAYNKYKGKLSKTRLHEYVTFFTSENIFKKFYLNQHELYINKNFSDNLKNQSIDTTFIVNQYGLEDNVARNKYMKNKNCIKLSVVVDTNGIPLDIKIVKGNCNDSPILVEQLSEMSFDTKTNKYKNSNRHKQYFLADAGYDSNKNIKFLKEKGYIPIIPKNKRGSSVEPLSMSESHKKIYKKRTIIENKFANYKQYRRVSKVYERNMDNYLSFAYMAFSKILFNFVITKKLL